MTRSEALEAMARGIAPMVAQHPWEKMAEDRFELRGLLWEGYDVNEPTRDDCREAAQAALQALEEGGMVVVPRARVPASMDEVDGQLPISCPSREPSPSTTVAPPSGLAGPQSSGAEG